ncbi:hypothetical protein GDO86_017971 [Hymenochirus boettgeri]|uniref:Four-jointed box kinase 1 n=1 Tax=Hymenochirus boettgeri TaxID=247094 RepID=A0A8T2ICN1_9PIPI|nr:hypothetical protein GDO86_017971 [Hymenochirus boettgeri]
MRATFTLIPSGFLLLVGGILWGWREAHPTERHRGPSHRSPRSVIIPSIRTSTGTPPRNQLTSTNETRGAGTDWPLEMGIFWPQTLERELPMVFTKESAERWQESARLASVVSLERGCGRSTNRKARLSDGSWVCVRFGINPEQIQGELQSYYLSRLLGIRGVPPCVLSRVGNAQWAPVQAELGATGWTPGALLSLTPWVYNLSSVLPPLALRAEGGKLHPLRSELRQDGGNMAEIAQWADLILFDYLTANFDRLVSNLFSLQWDPHVMLRGTNNLHQNLDGALVLLDNEAGLAHGYRLRDTWDKYNEKLLDTVCLFRRDVVHKVQEMHMIQSAAQELHSLYLQAEPLGADLGLLSEAQAKILQDRIGLVYRHIQSCQDRYS